MHLEPVAGYVAAVKLCKPQYKLNYAINLIAIKAENTPTIDIFRPLNRFFRRFDAPCQPNQQQYWHSQHRCSGEKVDIAERIDIFA
jgi:hypothetical protein